MFEIIGVFAGEAGLLGACSGYSDTRLARISVLQLAADENFNNDIIRGLFRRKLDVDIVRVQDVGLSGADDSAILEWAARHGRVLVTHDASTLTRHAYERVAAGQPMPGVFEVYP